MSIDEAPGALRRYFDHNDGLLIHKWLHYFPIYERHFERFRGGAVTMVEIGVSQGGSLHMWSEYLGPGATVVGVDIEPRVASLVRPGIEIVVGDQSDPAVLADIAERYGPFDIVLDDGSHLPPHQIASITHLWPHLRVGGIYAVEDLHTSYWADYGGGRGNSGSFIGWLHQRIDDMHGHHSKEDGFGVNDWTQSIGGMHLYDSIVIMDKVVREVPEHRMTGRPAFEDIYGYEADELLDELRLVPPVEVHEDGPAPRRGLQRFRRPRGQRQA